MNQSTNHYDQQLLSIDHFSHFPCMLPYIGPQYMGARKKLMIIAESHYLPPDSTINNDAVQWYGSNQQDLNAQEVAWINTREILAGDLKPRGHMIYKEINTRLAEHSDFVNKRPLNQVIVMNGFQRPAPMSGDSIKNFTVSKDVEISAKVLEGVINVVQPDAIIFASKYAWDTLKSKLKNVDNIKLDFVCHPGTGGRYWHNSEYPHGINKFRGIINKIYQN